MLECFTGAGDKAKKAFHIRNWLFWIVSINVIVTSMSIYLYARLNGSACCTDGRKCYPADDPGRALCSTSCLSGTCFEAADWQLNMLQAMIWCNAVLFGWCILFLWYAKDSETGFTRVQSIPTFVLLLSTGVIQVVTSSGILNMGSTSSDSKFKSMAVAIGIIGFADAFFILYATVLVAMNIWAWVPDARKTALVRALATKGRYTKVPTSI
jgi:hypothetical protein